MTTDRTPAEPTWKAYYDDYGEPACDGYPGRSGTMLVAPRPFDGDRIYLDGLTCIAAEMIAGLLNERDFLATQLAEEQTKVAALEGEKAALVEALAPFTPWEALLTEEGECFMCGGEPHEAMPGPEDDCAVPAAQRTLADLSAAAKAHDLAEQAKGAKALAEDIRAGVRHHVKECEAELRGQGYVCIHRINSATATVVLRLAKLHRAALLASPVAPEEEK
jgi:hypothetical protein